MKKMIIPYKSIHSGLKLPVLGLGTWMVGGEWSQDPTTNSKSEIESIQRAIDMGISHIDTAEMYAAGYTEQLVSAGIKPFKRENLFIASKVWDDNLRYSDLLNSAKQSLKRLETTYLDLYYIHNPNHKISLRETMRAMDTLVDEGIVRYVGLSNFSTKSIKRAQNYARNKISVVQAHFNLIFREPEETGLIDHCVENNIFLVAWRPLQCGALCDPRLPSIQRLRIKYNKTSAQIAINWLISQKNIVTISTMKSQTHLVENLKALNWNMDQKDVAWLQENFPEKQMISDAVPLS